MKWMIYFNNGLLAGSVRCDDKERGFSLWSWRNGGNHDRNNYYMVPASAVE